MMESLLLGAGTQLENEEYLMGISSRLQTALEKMLMAISDTTNQVQTKHFWVCMKWPWISVLLSAHIQSIAWQADFCLTEYDTFCSLKAFMVFNLRHELLLGTK